LGGTTSDVARINGNRVSSVALRKRGKYSRGGNGTQKVRIKSRSHTHPDAFKKRQNNRNRERDVRKIDRDRLLAVTGVRKETETTDGKLQTKGVEKKKVPGLARGQGRLIITPHDVANKKRGTAGGRPDKTPKPKVVGREQRDHRIKRS